MKRKHESGYYRFNQIDSSIAPKRTSVKYHKELIELGLVNPTKNGFRLTTVRNAMNILWGYSFWCVNRDYKTLNELTTIFIDSVVVNKLTQQQYAAKRNLESKKAREVKKSIMPDLEYRFLTGEIKARTSCRAMAKTLGVSLTIANKSLHRVVKKGDVKFVTHLPNPNKTRYHKLKFKLGLFECERYLRFVHSVGKNSLIINSSLGKPTMLANNVHKKQA